MKEQNELEDRQLIPTEFHSFSTGKPFDKCIDCNKGLLDGEPYMIEKAIRQYPGYSANDVIFEYAICVQCAERLKNEISQESMAKIQEFFASKINPMQMGDIGKTNECVITRERKEDLKEYQIYAYCTGKYLAPQQPPFMISGAIMDEISELLSDQTIDELNRFMDEHFGPPPELEDLPIGRKLILI